MPCRPLAEWQEAPTAPLLKDRVYLITAVSALAACHQPVVFHRPPGRTSDSRPVRGSYQRCSARIPAAARAR